ncbi:MAG: hypothetical protein M1822_006629 [Bathelium mastoideum]|nr:MAG: hypothetical protein M1822_006629 [Bathelium mastoideum]
MEQRLWRGIARLSRNFNQPFRTRQSTAFCKVKNPVPQRESGSISSYSQPASELNHDVGEEEIQHYDQLVAESKDKQIRTPWHRDGSDEPPVKRQRSAGAMTKGKLLTTPSRMLKLILPLTTSDHNTDRKSVEPLALLVHPQQPLSYLERLIQSELPSIRIKDKQGNDAEKIPNVHFYAEDSAQDSLKPRNPEDVVKSNRKQHEYKDENNLENPDETRIGGEVARTGKLSPSTPQQPAQDRAKDRAEHLPTGFMDDPASPHHHFVRWSSSTEVGDFIRDAARGREFAVAIERAPREILVGVPSFRDRTYYLRTRLRKKSREIAALATVKRECDDLARRGAQRMALGGLGVLASWWGVVYLLTFQTSLGWDVMEPVTYLVSLSTIMGGYVWFLYHNREVSYRSAMNFTISRRQEKLYESKGFDLNRWTNLVEEGNALRREIKQVAGEYDVDWDESMDEDVGIAGGEATGDGGKPKGEIVKRALREGRRKERKDKDKKKDKDEDDDE